MKLNIWIDDMRSPASLTDINVFRTAEDAIVWLDTIDYEIIDSINFWLDHDLGTGKSGYDFAKWFIEWNLDRNIPMKFTLLTSNPVGAFNIRQLLTHYGYSEFF